MLTFLYSVIMNITNSASFLLSLLLISIIIIEILFVIFFIVLFCNSEIETCIIPVYLFKGVLPMILY